MSETTYCVFCGGEIPADRAARSSYTCSKEHARKLKAQRRKQRDAKKCRHCGKPSTTDERKQFQRWRRTLPENLNKRSGRPKGAPNRKHRTGPESIADKPLEKPQPQ